MNHLVIGAYPVRNASAGLEMAWIQRPPEKVTDGEEFNVTYSVTASDSFYEYAVQNKIFQFG